MIYADGSVFQGDFQNGIRHCGSLTLLNGDVFEGTFDHQGLISGCGVLKANNGDVYSGDFLHGVEHGSGKK